MLSQCEVSHSHLPATKTVFPEFISNPSANNLNATQIILLPPIRAKGRNSLQPVLSEQPMATVSEDPISLWLKQGELEKLEQAVLDGYGDHLNGKTSRIPQVNRFLKQVPNFQAKIEEIHRAITLGKYRSVQHLIDRKKFAFCRDQMGATPLHKAVIYGQRDIINYLLERYGTTIHARDHRGRTALHYSAVLSDGGQIYKLLVEYGADQQATDMFGKKPEDYLQSQAEISAQVLREGAIVAKPRKSRKQTRIIDPSSSRFGSLMHRSNIKELIKQGNLSTLEEVVLQGFGDRLLGQTSTAPLVQDFLDNLPDYIDQITELHRAAMKGNLREFQGLLDRKAMIIARDQIGATPLHKAVLYGHYDLAEYIATNFPVTLDARDNDGRTALHYASALEDDRNFYNMLVKAGASPLLPDFKGKNADFYLRFPDQINLQQIMKRSQRLNANYTINTANRIKSKSPSRRKERSLSPSHRVKRPSDLNGIGGKMSVDGQSEEGLSDKADSSSNDGSNVSSNHGITFYRKTILPSPTIPRVEVSSANLKRWIQENNLEMLEGVVLEGHGEKLKEKAEYFRDDQSSGSQIYISETVPKIMNKIRVIHAAVSCGDLIGLQDNLEKDNLEKKDYVLSKDHLGMAPLHKATIMGHIDVVQYILEKFPETVNAKDKEGRTALHYSAATTNRNGNKIYKMLIRAGADPRIRDSSGKTAEYYRVHLLSLPNELSRINTNKKLNPLSLTDSQNIRRRSVLLPNIQEKISTALHDGDAKQLQELVLEGYGDSLFGRTSWGEEARKFLKGLPHLMDSIKSLHASIINGDISNVERILTDDPSLIRAKDENGLFPIHIATAHNQSDILNYLVTNFPQTVHFKDNSGRTPLHISAQNKAIDIYRKLVELGGDPKSMDQKGKTADHYLRVQTIHNYDFVSPSNGLDTRKGNEDSINNKILLNKSRVKPVSKPSKGPKPKTEPPSDETTLSMPTRLPSLFDETVGVEANQSIVEMEDQNYYSTQETESSVGLTTITSNAADSVDYVSDANVDNINNSDDNNDKMVLNQTIEDDMEKKIMDEEKTEEKNHCSEVPINEEQTQSIAEINVDKQVVDEQSNQMPNESVPESQITSENEQKTIDSVNEVSQEVNEASGESEQVKAENSLETTDNTVKDDIQNSQVDQLENTVQSQQPIEAESQESQQPTEAESQESAEAELQESAEAESQEPQQPTEVESQESTQTESQQPVENELQESAGTEQQATEAESQESTQIESQPPTETDAKPDMDNQDSDQINTDSKQETNQDLSEKSAETNEETVEPNVEQGSNEEAKGSESRKSSLTGANKEQIQSKRLSRSWSQQALLEKNSAKAQQKKMSRSWSQQSTESDKEGKNGARRGSNAGSRPSTQSGTQRRKSTESVKSLQRQSSRSSIKSGKLDTKENPISDIPPEVANNIAEKVINDSFDAIRYSEDSELWSKVIKEESEAANITQIDDKQREDSLPNDDELVSNQLTAEPNAQESVIDEGRQLTTNDEGIESAFESDQCIDSKPEDSEPADSKTEDSKTEDSKPEDTQPEDTQPENTQPEDTQPEDTQPEHTQPEHTELESTQSENTQSEPTEPEATADQKEVNQEENTINQSEHLINIDQKVDSDSKHVDNNLEDTQNNEVSDNVNEGNQVEDKVDENQPESDSEEKNEVKSTRKSATAPEERSLSRQSDVNISPHADDRLNELIDHWLEEGDLLRLEHVVIAGQGERLIGRTSANRQVQDFLELVPTYMAKIRTVHETVIRGNLNEVKQILTRKRFALSRDHFGASPLHLSVLHGHLDVMVYIIGQFPETINGPDNEGRTPLHYSAVMSDEQKQFYRILESAGANTTLKDKSGRTPEYYLKNSGELTIRQLLENYMPPSESRAENLDNAEVWQRPPTADIESRLTPTPTNTDSPMASPIKSNIHEVDAEVHVDADSRSSRLRKNKTFDRSISQSSFKTRTDEQLAEDEDFETMSNEFQKSLKEEKVRLQKSFDKQMSSTEGITMSGSVIESVQEARPPIGSAIINGENSSGYDLTEIKDEYGRTVLHLAAAKPQKRTVFYKMLSQAEYLIPERDLKYRTIRDISVQNGIKDNLQVIDQYILDAFVKENVPLVRTLALEGYDNLLTVVDSEGNDVIATLKKNNITSMNNLIQDLAQFQKNRDELHTFIRHGYAEGVFNLTEADSSLVIAKSERGRSALHIAILFANLEIIETLINANPKAVNTPDNMGRTPLHYAMASSLVEQIGRILIHSGANRAMRDVRMRTPSYYFVYKQEIRDIKREEQNLTI